MRRLGLVALTLLLQLVTPALAIDPAVAEEIVVSNYGVAANGMPYAIALEVREAWGDHLAQTFFATTVMR